LRVDLVYLLARNALLGHVVGVQDSLGQVDAANGKGQRRCGREQDQRDRDPTRPVEGINESDCVRRQAQLA
jgi:hypothetical protein